MMVHRSGRVRILVSVAVVFVLTVLLWRMGLLAHGATPGVFFRADHFAYGLILTAGALVMVGLTLRVEGAPVSSLGLARPGDLMRGALWFLIPAAGGLGAVLLMGWGEASLIASPGEAVWKFALLTVLVLLSEALPEELIFRGYLQSRLTGLVGAWGAVILQAGLFTLFAVAIEAARTGMDIGFIASFGVALGVLRAASGTLWAPVGFHLAFMVVQQSYGAGWELVALTLPEMMRMLVLTQIPFALVIALLFSRVGKAQAV